MFENAIGIPLSWPLNQKDEFKKLKAKMGKRNTLAEALKGGMTYQGLLDFTGTSRCCHDFGSPAVILRVPKFIATSWWIIHRFAVQS